MNSPFASIIRATRPAGKQHETLKQLFDGASVDTQRHNSDLKPPPRSADIIPFPAGSQPYLDHSANIERLSMPLTRFPGLKRVEPDREVTCSGWSRVVMGGTLAEVIKRRIDG
jgi:hypothetical protein